MGKRMLAAFCGPGPCVMSTTAWGSSRTRTMISIEFLDEITPSSDTE